MNREIFLLIFVIVVMIILAAGILYFFNKGEDEIKNEEFDDFLWTFSDFDTFLTIMLAIVIPVGLFIIFRLLKR